MRARSKKHIAPWLAATAAALAACALAAPAATAKSSQFYGIVGTPDTKADAKRMAKAHVGSLRIGFTWAEIQTTHHGSIYWGAIDSFVRRAAQKRISVLPILAGTPSYEAPCTGDQCQRRIRVRTKGQRHDWKAFVNAAVKRYGPGGNFWRAHRGLRYKPIRRWQIWNEESNPKQGNSPGTYAKLVKLADQAIGKKGKVILGGMPGHTAGRPKTYAWNYLKSLYRHGAARHFDGVSLHPYSPSVSGMARQVKKIRRVMKGHHDAKTPVLLTEIGWGSSKKRHGGTGGRGAAFNVGPRKQKQKLAASYKLLHRHRRSWNIDGVYWYTWKDPKNPPAGLCAFCYSSGLYKANGRTAKPALGAFRRLAG